MLSRFRRETISRSCTDEGGEGSGRKANLVPFNEYFLDICAAPAGDLSWHGCIQHGPNY